MTDKRHDRSIRFKLYIVIVITIPIIGYGGSYMYKSLGTLDSISCDYRINKTTNHFETMPEQDRKECEGLKQFGFISSIGLLPPIGIISFFLVRRWIYPKTTNKIQKVKSVE